MAEQSDNESSREEGRGFWARFGLQVSLMAILGLAALSFITLGMIKHGSQNEQDPQAIVNTQSGRVPIGGLDNAPKPPDESSAKPPSETGGDQAAGGSDQAPGDRGPADQPPDETPAPDQAVAGDDRPPADKPAGGEDSPPPDQPKPPPETRAAQAPGETEASPGPEPGAEDKGPKIPRPQWQALDQQWDKVVLDEIPEDELKAPDDASWKQVGVGETDAEAGDDQGRKPPSDLMGYKPKPKPEDQPSEEENKDKPAKPEDTVTPKTPGQTTVASRPPAKPRRYVAPRSKTRRRTSSVQPKRGLKLAVINESGDPAQGQVYRDVLRAMGYSVTSVVDRVPQPGPTTILYRQGLKSTALALARRIPGQRTVVPKTWQSNFDIVILVR